MGPNKVLVDMQASKDLESARNAAIDAASKTKWDGEGLPPVGCECEFNAHDRGWEKCSVLYASKHTLLLHTDRISDPEEAFVPEDVVFRPIRTEADKKKYGTIGKMLSVFFGTPPVEEPNENDRVAMAELYDAIKSGKIVID